jgi:nucleoside 2-deoxyribosyltransferase
MEGTSRPCRSHRRRSSLATSAEIIDQVWRGINAAKVLVAELTTRNANAFYELGLAHALNKPVVLSLQTKLMCLSTFTISALFTTM